MFKKVADFIDSNNNIVNTFSSLQLAYIGDAVHNLYVRSVLMINEKLKVNKLNKKANEFVSAKAQSYIVDYLVDELTDEEYKVFKRGRNAKSSTSPKNTDIIDYKKGTGFEALIGYLYLKGENERLKYILKRSMEIKQNNK